MGRWVWRAVAVVWLGGWLNGCGPMPSGPRPLPAGPQAVTVPQVQEAARRFYQRLYADAYARWGNRSAPWASGAQVFVRASVAHWANRDDKAAARAVDAALTPLLGSGVDDPLVCLLVGLRLQESDDGRAAQWLKQAVDGARDARYPAQALCLGPPSLFRELKGNRVAPTAPAEVLATDQRALWSLEKELLVRAFDEPVRRPIELRLLLRRIERAGFEEAKDAQNLLTIVQKARRADPWYAHVLRGRLAVDEAWKARGSGYANTVSRTGWEGFARQLQVARKEYVAAWRRHPELPEAAAAMIDVAKGGGAGPGETPRLWFDRAVVAQFDYPPAYDKLAWALMPRWGGSHEAMLALARECLATQRFDTSVPLQYYLIVRFLAQQDDQPGIWDDPRVQQELDTATAGLVAAAPESERVRWQLVRAQVLGQIGRVSDAYPLVQGPLDAEDVQWLGNTLSVDPQSVVGYVRALGGPDDHARRAKQAHESGDAATALKLYRAAGQQSDDPHVRYWLTQRRRALLLAQDGSTDAQPLMAKGVLIPGDDLDLWTSSIGTWTVGDDGTLSGCRSAGQVAHLAIPAQLPASCRVRLLLRCPADRPAVVCLSFGVPRGSVVVSRPVQLRWQSPAKPAPATGVAVDLPQARNEVVLERTHGEMSLTVNGETQSLESNGEDVPWRLYLDVDADQPVTFEKLQVDPF